MKTLVLLLALLLCFPVSVLAQNSQSQEKTVTIPVSKLTEQQKKDLDQSEAQAAITNEQKALEQKVNDYGKWVGVGHELGTAVNESLSAVTNNTASFGNTSVGKITIFLVVWKVIGKDLLHYLIGIIVLLIGAPIWIWSFYSNCITRRINIGTAKEPDWCIVNNPSEYFRGDVNYITLQRFWHLLALFALGIFVASISF